MSHNKYLLRTAIVAAIFSTPAPLIAQSTSADDVVRLAQNTQTGSLQGRVVDAGTGNPLQGAIIRIRGTSLDTTTTREGTFLLPSVPVGERELVVEFIGYQAQTESTVISVNARQRVDVALAPSAFLEGMEVVGYRGAQSRALSQQRASDRIVNVVSADTLGDFPDISVAESVARISGVAVTRHRGDADAAVIRGGDPSWTRVAVDGMNIPSAGGGRSVALGQLSSEVISGIEVTKAPTPDMDADAIGGTINIVSRGALTSSAAIAGKASYGYSELGGRNNHDVALSGAHVFDLETGSHGFQASISQNSVDREMNNVESAFTTVNGEFRPDRVQTKAYDILRERGALELRYDFMNVAEDTHLYVGFTHSTYRADEDRHNISIRRNGNVLEGSTFEEGSWQRARIEQTWTDRHDESKQNLLVFGGKREFGGRVWDFGGAFSQAENERKPGRTSWTYRWDAPRQVNYNFSDPDFPVLTFADTGEVPNVGGNFDADNLRFRHGSNYLQERLQEETSFQLQTNLQIPMSFAGNNGYLKFGAKATERDRENDENRFIIDAGGPELSQILGSAEINNFGRFPFGSRFNKPVTNQIKDQFTVSESISNSFSGDFSIKEQVFAGYGMGVVDIDRWRFIAGARVEHTRTDSQGFRSDDNWATVPTPTQLSRSYTNVFPGLHAKMDVTDNLVFRTAYTTGINRPSFSNLRPTVSVSPDNQSVSASNNSLKPATSQAFDLMLEYYIQPIGLISAGVFAKQIKDVHFSFSRDIVPGEVFNGFVVNDAGWRLSEIINSDRNASIQGAELSWDQALTFLPAPFDGLGVFANYTYTRSEASLPSSGDKVPLGAQPQDTVNFAVYYEKSGFSTRLAYNFQAKRISNYGDGTPEGYNWWDDRSILDLTARYRVNDNFTVYLEANNLTDSVARRYLGDRSRVYELEDFGRSYSLGLRFNF